MDPRLETRLADPNPKCATCAHYVTKDGEAIGQCVRHMMTTLDLAVCSDWEPAE